MPGKKEKGFRHIENKKKMAVIYLILRSLVIVVMIAQFYNRDYQNVFLCILTLILFMMPSIIERRFRIDLPDTLEIIILLFIFAAEILGEVSAYYQHFPYWDTMLHTMNGFLCAAIGVSLVDLLNRSNKVTFQLSPLFIGITAFCFSMTVGVLWEFFEYFMDTQFFLDMQKDTVIQNISTVMLDDSATNKTVFLHDIADTVLIFEDGSQRALGVGGYLDVGLTDTMDDLLVNFIGAFTFSIIGYFYVKRRGKGGFAHRFIPRAMPEETGASGEEEQAGQASFADELAKEGSDKGVERDREEGQKAPDLWS